MLKRKILAAVLPVVAAGTVVGSGFSAWYFGEFSTTNTSNVSVGIDVSDTGKQGIGELTTTLIPVEGDPAEYDSVSNKLVLNLDQGKGSDRISNVNKGISFTNTSGKVIKTIDFTYTIESADLMALLDAGLQLNIDVSMTMSSTLSKYVDFRKASSSSDLDNNIYTSDNGVVLSENTDTEDIYDFTKSISVNSHKSEDGDYTLTFALNLGSYSADAPDSNGLLVYKSNDDGTDLEFNGKPKNTKQVSTMTTNLEKPGEMLSFKFSVTTSDKTASN